MITEADVKKSYDYLMKAGLEDWNIDNLKRYGYFDAPASKGHHLAVPGGLFKHSVNVTSRLLDMSLAMHVQWSQKRSSYLVGMLHDFVKCFTYTIMPDGRYGFQTPRWPGHGVASVLAIGDLLGIQLTPQESAAIVWHMGAFGLDGDALKQYDAALGAFPLEILATHTADMLASRVDERGV